MKKYSSNKSFKPLNTSLSYLARTPQSPTHSSSYRKLGTIDLSNQRPLQRQQIYPLSAKYSNYSAHLNSTTNANRQKMFSNKTTDSQLNRPLTLNMKQQNNESGNGNGYGSLKSKINDLESRINEIKKNYDATYQQKKQNEKNNKVKESQKSVNKNGNISRNNKENQPIKNKDNQAIKKSQSKLMLERYHANKRKSTSGSASTINLHPVQNRPNDYSKPPLSPKNIANTFNKKNQNLPKNSLNQKSQKMVPCKVQVYSDKEKEKNFSKRQSNQGQNNSGSTYLKEYVTTFTCGNQTQSKHALTHSTSESNLYKPQNKLSAKNPQITKLYYVSAIISAHEAVKPNSFQTLCRNHMTSSLQILTYIKNAKKQPPRSFTAKPLPRVKDNKHTIIFDLDETLIHCNQNLNIQHDIALPIKFPNGAVIKAGINIRPYARECLKELSKYFELIVFTASHECYGNVIVDYLDPNKEYISHRYFRDSCHKTEEGFYIKDLRVIDRDLSKVLLIDNAAYSYCFQLENGVPVVPFYDNKADLELKNLTPYLKSFLTEQDVRKKNNNQMKLTRYTQFKDIKSLISKLYLGE